MNCAVRVCCAAIAVILMSGPVFANAADIGKAEVVVPDAKSTSVENEERILRVGADVFKDDIVQTGKIGAVMLQFNDKTTLKVFPNSKIKLDNYVYESDNTVLRVGLNLLSGAMRIASGGPHTADKYQLRTPHATIGIRGTVIHIVSDHERTVIEALHGSFYACATTGTACRTVSATDDVNTLGMWCDGRIELVRVRRDLGVRSAQGSSDISATRSALSSESVVPIGDLEGNDRGGTDVNNQLAVNSAQSAGSNPPVVSLNAVRPPATLAPGTGQGAAAATDSSVRSLGDTLLDFGGSGPSQSDTNGKSSGGVPSPEVNAGFGMLLAGATFVFLRRKRGVRHEATAG